MATKYKLQDKCLFDIGIDSNDTQYNNNLNLNQKNFQNSSLYAFSETSKSISTKNGESLNNDFSNNHDSKKDSYPSWNKSIKDISGKIVDYQKNEDKWKNDKNAINGSTLSLHISTYEKSVKAASKFIDGTKEKNSKHKNTKQIFNVSTSVFQVT
uniref:Uncharacterized protein n=1 Tax=Panagrolaimus sp. PS1159 TaxID=55785 RepID=A0AC35FH32_9BILA